MVPEHGSDADYGGVLHLDVGHLDSVVFECLEFGDEIGDGEAHADRAALGTVEARSGHRYAPGAAGELGEDVLA